MMMRDLTEDYFVVVVVVIVAVVDRIEETVSLVLVLVLVVKMWVAASSFSFGRVAQQEKVDEDDIQNKIFGFLFSSFKALFLSMVAET
jgi:hypothetical protein